MEENEVKESPAPERKSTWKPGRKYVPAKRVKTLFRKSGAGRSLKQFMETLRGSQLFSDWKVGKGKSKLKKTYKPRMARPAAKNDKKKG